MGRSSRAAVLLALFLAGCPAADQAECSADADCGSGKRCSSGTCVGSQPSGGGGSGGEGPLLDGCGASDDCKSEEFRLVPTVYWDGGDGDPVCTVPPGGCPQGGTCRIPTACLDPLDAPREGLFRCAADEECTTGRCLEVGGVGLCLRTCASDDDCPLTVRVASPPAGFRCGEVVHRGVPVRSCLPVDEAHPERTLCARAEDCAAPGARDPAFACRFVGRGVPWMDAVPVCERDAPALHPTGSACPASGSDPAFAASCDGGVCVQLCSGGAAEVALCEPPEYFCSRPCDRDADCPGRMICRNGSWAERVGSWKIPGMQNQDEEDGRDVRFCQLPDLGCFDEIDCCPVPDGAGGCLGGWSGARDRCTVLPAPGGSDDRLITVCNQPAPGAPPPGSCCAAHDDCDSLLCVPAREGTPCAGGGVCSVPCSPFPDPDGVPGSGDERERCALGDFAGSTYHQASRCQPFEYSRSYTDPRGVERTAAATLQVCR